MTPEQISTLGKVYGLTAKDTEMLLDLANAILKIAPDYPTLVSYIKAQKISQRERIYLALFCAAIVVGKANIKKNENGPDGTNDGTDGQVHEDRPSRKSSRRKEGSNKK